MPKLFCVWWQKPWNWWKGSDRVKPTYLEKICCSAIIYKTHSAWTGLRSKAAIRDKIPATDGLNQGRTLGALTGVHFVWSDPTTFPVPWVSLSDSLQRAGLSPQRKGLGQRWNANIWGGNGNIPLLTLILLTWRIGWVPNNASKWQMGFNLAFKGLKIYFF